MAKPFQASKAFESALMSRLKAKSRPNLRTRRLIALLEDEDSPRRRRRLAFLESHARTRLGVSMSARVNWEEVDWEAILEMIFRLLAFLVQLFA